ncbi:MAG: tRNA (guanine-N1)-methyltransferase [Flavobacteriaceae bacterium]|nr:tRNA (guanine-N1)-methyltransferase [Mangrovimonas sp.]MCB0426752.1 tRNA (guanine-N1)-methyltransferase [Mangrovimonas sp.]MCB0435704.1 tRNA (guanine-N1)-methyltransferase [Mangrovimonas sp.]MCB0438735.1 tRNA (guanine-N1)-methyltransferase [Mangrovimonas sp.]HPF96843.1 tRNA (guanine-N1)-methyltransferase [Mangrovimonas sp.]
MKYFKPVAFVLLALFSIQLLSAQETNEDQLSLNEGTLDNQFEYVIQKSNNYQDYKVIKKTWLYALKAHTMDSLKAIQSDLKNTQATVDSQAKEISDLKNNLTSTQSTLDFTNKEKDSMSLFGIQMSKSGYNILLWGIIGILLALLGFFIYKFKNSNTITKESKKALADIELEFEEHRKVALEREQKVRRQLQDELNKQKKEN